jgi:TonB family protein
MAPELHGRVRTLFDEALSLPEAERLPFLQSASSCDPEVLPAVMRLLEAHRGSQWFLETDTRPRQRIGRYIVTGELGRGAMGVVYEAIDPLIGRKVAVKVMRLQSFADAGEARFLRDRLFREARSAGLLSHPGVVVVFDVGQEGDLAFIAMERVEGVSLYQALASGRGIARAEALEILRQAAAALDYAHRNGVVHRDIKPANIMLDKGVTVKVADFGIAKITSTEHQTVTRMVMGTPSYMSPEQIEALPLDGRSDQFSLAVIAYELLTGRRPFQADSLATLAHMIVYADRPSARAANPGLPPAVDVVLRRSLARLPNDRYPSCTEFVAALQEASNDIWRPPLNVLPPLPQPMPAPLAAGGGKDRRVPIRYVLGGAVLAAVLTGVLLNKVLPLRQAAPVVETQPAASPGAKVTVHRKSNKTSARLAKDSGAKPGGGGAVTSPAPTRAERGPMGTTSVPAGPGTISPDGIYRTVGNGVSAPLILSRVGVEYTEVGRKLLVDGLVYVDVVIQRDGTQRDRKVVGPMGYGLDEKALEAVREWRFRPAMKDGKAVPFLTDIGSDVPIAGPRRPDTWHSGPMVFGSEAGRTQPVVTDGTMPKPVQELSDECVILDFTVDSSGSPKGIHSTYGSESASAFLAHYLATWKFRPALKGNRPVEAMGRVRFAKGKGDNTVYQRLSPPGAILTPLNPATVDDKSASISSNTAALIEFVNRSSSAVDIYWINDQGNRRLDGGSIAVGATYTERTFLTHPFLVVVSGTGGTTAKDTGTRLAAFEAVTPNPNRDPAKRDIAIITDRAYGSAAANVPGDRPGR